MDLVGNQGGDGKELDIKWFRAHGVKFALDVEDGATIE